MWGIVCGTNEGSIGGAAATRSINFVQRIIVIELIESYDVEALGSSTETEKRWDELTPRAMTSFPLLVLGKEMYTWGR